MRFQIQAVNARQAVVSLAFEAATEAGAIESARRQGLTVLSVRALGAGLKGSALLGGTALARSLGKRGQRFSTPLFSMELVALLDAGLNLVEALQTLSLRESHGERHAVLSGIVAALNRGEPFSQALAHHPRHFPALYLATVKASERSGNLRESLQRYVEWQEELDRVRKKVVSALIYPAILMAVGSLVIGFLILYVLPRFALVYDDISARLPFFSALLLALGRVIREHAWGIGLGGLAAVAAGAWALAQAAIRARLVAALWRLPAIGARMKLYQLARLYRSAGMLLRAGIPALKALEMTEGLLSANLQPQLARARRQVEQGRPMSAALDAEGLATPVAARMMAVGEKSGEMGAMLARIARFHDDELARDIDWFTRAFEPLLMAALGLAVGVVVVLMYMPIFELAGSLE